MNIILQVHVSDDKREKAQTNKPKENIKAIC
jgi:hypothetical protein